MLRREFQWHRLGFNHDEPSYFVNSQWPWLPPSVFIIYRAAVSTYFIVWFIWTLVWDAYLSPAAKERNYVELHSNMKSESESPDLTQVMLLDLSHWVLFTGSMFSTLAALAVFHHHIIRARRKRFAAQARDFDFPMSVSSEPITLNTDSSDFIQIRVITDVTIDTPWQMRAAWYFQSVTLNSFVVSAALFWISTKGGYTTATSLHNNGVMIILLLIDVYLSKLPIRYLHALHSCIFFSFYSITSYIYFKLNQGGNYLPIYELLDWRRPLVSFTAVTTIALVVIPLVHLFWFAVHKSRFHLWKKYGQTQ